MKANMSGTHIFDFEIAVKYMAYFRLSDATGLYISWCPLLDIKSQGRSEEEAKASLNDAVRMFVADIYRRGILDEVLLGLGLEPGPDASDGEDGGDELQESVSVRPVEWKSWIGKAPVDDIDTARKMRSLRKRHEAAPCPQ